MRQLNGPPQRGASACPAEEVAEAAGVGRPAQRSSAAPAASVRRRWYAQGVGSDGRQAATYVGLDEDGRAVCLDQLDRMAAAGFRDCLCVGLPFWPERDELRRASASADAERAAAGVGDGRDWSDFLGAAYWRGRGY